MWVFAAGECQTIIEANAAGAALYGVLSREEFAVWS